MDEKTLDQIGQLVDKADNYLQLGKMPLPSGMVLDGMKQGLQELREALKELYLANGGEYHAAWKLVENND